MARTAGSKNTKPQLDPLLAALIARLPRSNADFPTKDRVAWLEMMERALDVVYPRSVEDVPLVPLRRPNGYTNGSSEALSGDERYPFYIDRENYARMAGGIRIDAVEVDGPLFDLRGEGDLGAIIWADGSTGVLGKVLDVKPA